MRRTFPMPQPLQQGFSLDREQVVLDLEVDYLPLGEALRQLEST